MSRLQYIISLYASYDNSKLKKCIAVEKWVYIFAIQQKYILLMNTAVFIVDAFYFRSVQKENNDFSYTKGDASF